MGRAWARLTSYFYKERAIGALSHNERRRAQNRAIHPTRDDAINSDEERETLSQELRESRR